MPSRAKHVEGPHQLLHEEPAIFGVRGSQALDDVEELVVGGRPLLENGDQLLIAYLELLVVGIPALSS